MYNCFNTLKVYFDTSGSNYKSEEVYFRLKELILKSFNEESVFTESFEDLSEMLFVLFADIKVDEDVVNIS